MAYCVAVPIELRGMTMGRKKIPEPEKVLISARQCDKAYSMKTGTTRDAYRSGHIRGIQRPGVLYVRRDDADVLFGCGGEPVPEAVRVAKERQGAA